MIKRLTQLLAIGLLVAAACLPSKAHAQLSNECSYPPAATPSTQPSTCWMVLQNGVSKTLKASQITQQSVQGPTMSVVGNFPIFNNTTGTLLADSGFNSTAFVRNLVDSAAMVALPVAGIPNDGRVRVMNYNQTNRQFAPPVEYFLNQTSCTIDNGSCFAAASMGYYWHLAPQTIFDPRWWGAYGDVKKKTLTTAISSGNCTVVVTGAGFVQTDEGKLITITNIAPGGGAYGSAGYQGSIQTYVNANQITVAAPCPNFTVNSVQNVYYGHDDGAPRTNQTSGPINAAIAYLRTILQSQQLSGQPQLNGGGLSYGTTYPIVANNNNSLAEIDFVGLSTTHFPIASTGVLSISCSFCTGFHVHVDAGFLPINACFANTNGTIYWQDLRCNNWMGEGPSVNATGAASNNAATFTGQLGACSGTGPYQCILTVTAVASGKIQPGQALSDCVGGVGNNCNVNLPIGTGTYIDGFKSGSGGIGTYSVTNNDANPGVVSSETMYSLSLNITVANCNSDNGSTIVGNLWPVNGSGTLLVGRGEISRGNEGNGVLDRSFIVGCKDATTAVLNKAPEFNFSNKTLTFYQEPNGFYMYGTATGNNYNTGLQINNLTISNDSQDYVTNINTKFGCALMDDSGGGTTIDKGAIAYGAAQICFGPDHHNTLINHMVTVSGAVGQVNEINEPAAISLDGSDNIILNQFEFGGQLQFFAVNGGSFANKTISITNPVIYANLARTNLAPNNTIWFYSGQTAATSQHITVGPASQNYNNPGAVNYVTFTTSSAGGWEAFSAAQIAQFSQAMNVNIPLFEQPTMFPGAGISLGTAPLSAAEAPYILLSSSYTLQEADSGTFFDIAGSTLDINIPASLSANATNPMVNASAWSARIFPRGASTVRVVPLTGATIWQAGGSTTSAVSLIANFEYFLDCPRNTAGSTPVCFLSKQAN